MNTTELAKYRELLKQKLHEKNSFNDFLAKVEQRTGVDRVYLVSGLVGVLSLYMVLSNLAELICNMAGVLYPAYMSIKAIESEDKSDDTQWLTYWVIFACFSIFDFASDTILSWFPLYWLVKCCFLIYLYLPVTQGARKMYFRFVRPLVLRHQQKIDEKLSFVAGKMADELSSNMVNNGRTIAAAHIEQQYNQEPVESY